MDARYIKAITILPAQVTVFGKKLLPFCFRHRVMLEAVDSPFIKPECKDFKPIDIVIAAKIISTFDKMEMVKPLSFWEKFKFQIYKYNKHKVAEDVGRIIGHIYHSCSYPKLWEKEGKKTQEKAPWVLTCLANNVRNGCSYEEAWTMPEGEAVWMSISHAIYNGSKIEILSTQEEEQLELIRKQMENKNQPTE